LTEPALSDIVADDGYAGAAIAKAGTGAPIASGWTKTLIFIVLAPVTGLTLGFSLMVLLYWLFRNFAPFRVDFWFRKLQLVSARSV